MKKITKQSLDELAKTMPVIPEATLNGIVGAYDPYDCVWHCLAYAANCGSNYGGDAGAFNMAQKNYSYKGQPAISPNGSYVFTGSVNDLRDFATYGMSSSCGSSTRIMLFNPNQVTGWSGSSGMEHVVIITGTNSNGYNYYDPKSGVSGNISYYDANNAGRGFVNL